MKWKVIFLIIPLAALSCFVSGQNDSLINQFKRELNLATTASAKVELSYKLSLLHLSKNRDTSIVYADKAIELSKKMVWIIG